jgi:predicted transcriptional regulator
MANNTSTFLQLTASIVSAYVRHNSVPSAELPALIGQVHTALTRVSSGHGEALGDALRPAVPIKKSIASDNIICREDGKEFKSLKRYLHQSGIVRSGVLAATIPWWRRTTPPHARVSPNKWD